MLGVQRGKKHRKCAAIVELPTLGLVAEVLLPADAASAGASDKRKSTAPRKGKEPAALRPAVGIPCTYCTRSGTCASDRA